MDETQIETPTVKTRTKRRYTKSAIVLTVGKTRLPADSVEITDKFVIARSGRKQTYFVLSAIDQFSVENKGKEPVPMAIAIQTGPTEAGGPKAFRELLAKQRNREIESLMGNIPSES